MSELENRLHECGLLGPLQDLLKKKEEVKSWGIALISMGELAGQTMSTVEFRLAIRTMYKRFKAEEELVCNAQVISSPESTAESDEKGAIDFSKRGELLSSAEVEECHEKNSPIRVALEKCKLLGPLCKLVTQNRSVNLWDVILLCLESVARKGSADLDFEKAVEQQWKLLKHKKVAVLEKNVSNPEVGSSGGSEYALPHVETVLEKLGILRHIHQIIDSGDDITCFDLGLVSIQEVCEAAGVLTDYKLALKRAVAIAGLEETEKKKFKHSEPEKPSTSKSTRNATGEPSEEKSKNLEADLGQSEDSVKDDDSSLPNPDVEPQLLFHDLNAQPQCSSSKPTFQAPVTSKPFFVPKRSKNIRKAMQLYRTKKNRAVFRQLEQARGSESENEDMEDNGGD